MSGKIEAKQKVVAQIVDRIKEARITVFANCRGLTVQEFTALRTECREAGGQVKVFKNTLTRRALEELSMSCPDEYLAGPTALITTDGDSSQVAKALVNFAKENELVAIKGGVMKDGPVDMALIQELAKLPSRDELIAKTVGGVKSPLTNLVFVLSGQISGLVNVLRSVHEKQSGGEQS